MADSKKYALTNIFDIDNPNILNGYIDGSGNYVPYATNGTLYVPITAGTSYTVSGIIRASQSIVVRIATFTAIPSTQTSSVNLYTLNQGDSITITAGNNENYLLVMFCGDSDYNAYGSVQAALTTNCANLHIDTYAWQHSLRKLTTATEAVENPLYSDGTAITAYTIKGNEEHTGTPSPSNPVMPNGVGNKTANLLDMSTVSVGYHLDVTTGLPVAFGYNSRMATLTAIDVSQFSAVTLAYTSVGDAIQFMYSIFDGTDTLIERVAGKASGDSIDVSSAAKLYIAFYRNAALTINSVEEAMLNEGVTPQSFEPYGYKIPILSGGVTTNIDLGSTQTVRPIKKLVLTGEESGWFLSGTNSYGIANYGLPNALISYITNIPISTHFVYQTTLQSETKTEGIFTNAQLSLYVRVYAADLPNKTAFVDWLKAQYTNGTPVTIWYILATPETGIVNEPLMKIGDYADTLSNATAIPTTEGANSITVDTTVQPSEFSATWTGWHNAYVKEKSENLCDYSTFADNYYLDITTGLPKEYSSTPSRIATLTPCDVTNINTVTLSYTSSLSGDTKFIYSLFNGNTLVRRVADNDEGAVIDVSDGDKLYLSLYNVSYTVTVNTISSLMLNEGSTALPYEPYWK